MMAIRVRARALAALGLLLPLALMTGWTTCADAQAVVGQVQLTSTGVSTSGTGGGGYAQGHVYFCGSGGGQGSVWKVVADGPASTNPSEVNGLTLSAACQEGTVRGQADRRCGSVWGNLCLSCPGRFRKAQRRPRSSSIVFPSTHRSPSFPSCAPILRWTQTPSGTGLLLEAP